MVWDHDMDRAAEDALAFIKQQMNSSQFTHTLALGEEYGEEHAGQLVWCKVLGFNDSDAKEMPQHIAVDQFFSPEYSGEVSGTWSGLDDYTQYAVDVYEVTDQPYLVCSCALRPDGTWRTEKLVKVVEIYDAEIVTYYRMEPINVKVGSFKDIRLVRKNWEGIPIFSIPEPEISANDSGAAPGVTETIPEPIAVSDEVIERPFVRYRDYRGRLYSYTDTEYLTAECDVYAVGEEAFFFTTEAYAGKKIAKLVRQQDNGYTVVGMCGAANITEGRFPASYLIPEDDPQYDRDGSRAMNLYGYMLNSRCFIYDAGLALIAFTISGDHALCVEMMKRLRAEQNADGSFNFSYDNYIGQLFEGYVRTGAMGWLVHGMCYYTLKTGDEKFVDMIVRAGDWLLSRQITDEKDRRFGLLTGGYGSYNMDDYSYVEGEIEWCSTEHNCSALQALMDLALVLGDAKYKQAAAMVKNALTETLYDEENARFYQGVSADGVDDAWAVDCCTWAGKTLLSIFDAQRGGEVADTVDRVYVTQGKSIVMSQEKEHYNTRYSGATVDGVKPYADGYNDPPDIVWSEGTLGYVALLKALGENEKADHYLNEMMKLQYCHGSTGGILYVTQTWASLPWEFHAWESVVSSAWFYILAKDPNALFPITAKLIDLPVVSRKFKGRGYAAIRPLG